jgi:hypothetical protein
MISYTKIRVAKNALYCTNQSRKIFLHYTVLGAAGNKEAHVEVGTIVQ